MKHPEDDIQRAVIHWARLSEGSHPELKLLFHCPNGGCRDKREAARLKSLGVKPGVPDLMLPVPRSAWHGLAIELKSEKGRLSDPQKEWHSLLQWCGWWVCVCRSFDEAQKEILEYL